LKQIKSLGILAGGAPESVAKELELDSVVQSVTNEAQNAKKLESGRLDAWMSQGMMASWGIRYSGIDPSTIKRAFEVRDLPLWVATSKKTSPESVEKLKKAFEAFRASPAYRDIIARY
jgi:polar amino acid transport system substrate-binding protein